MKNLLTILLIIFVVIQFFKPEKNESNDQTYAMTNKFKMSAEMQKTFEVACYDCHSNKSTYPWYANIQPVAWFLNHHIEDGKKHMNYSTFLKLPIAVQNHKFEETAEMVEKKEMPLESYTYFGLHKEAKLTDNQRKDIVNWAHAQMDKLKAHYPADSLVMKKRKA